MITVIEVMRRLYSDLVKRRASVRIIQAQADLSLSHPPIFIIGVYRSGTTLLRYCLDSHSHICSPPETDFIAPLAQLTTGLYSQGLLDMGYQREHVIRQLRALIVYFFANYAASVGKLRWADKTPSYVDYLEFISELFPEAQFIMVYRHGLDQAHSFTRGGSLPRPALQDYCHTGEDLRIGAVRYWRDKTEKMLAFEDHFPERSIHLRYEDLAHSPEDHLRAIFAFLGEDWEPAVMRYYDFPHDKGREDGRVAATRAFMPAENHHLQWPQVLHDACWDIARPVLVRLGYNQP